MRAAVTLSLTTVRDFSDATLWPVLPWICPGRIDVMTYSGKRFWEEKVDMECFHSQLLVPSSDWNLTLLENRLYKIFQGGQEGCLSEAGIFKE
jgi:hypothetical protein